MENKHVHSMYTQFGKTNNWALWVSRPPGRRKSGPSTGHSFLPKFRREGIRGAAPGVEQVEQSILFFSMKAKPFTFGPRAKLMKRSLAGVMSRGVTRGPYHVTPLLKGHSQSTSWHWMTPWDLERPWSQPAPNTRRRGHRSWCYRNQDTEVF